MQATPENFPVIWEDPTDVSKSWCLDELKEPISPLEFSILPSLFVSGVLATARIYGLHVTSPEFRRMNTYLYSTPASISTSADGLHQLLDEEMGSVIAQLGSIWQNAFLPEIKEYLTTWKAFDLQAIPLPVLLSHLTETLARSKRLAELHFRIFWPAIVAISEFDELYHDLFGTEDPFGSYSLLQGFSNKTLETGQQIWILSRKARSLPEVLRLFETCETDEILAFLHTSEGSQKFLPSLHHFLEVYGSRGDKYGLSYATWAEDPRPVLSKIKNYVKLPDTTDPEIQRVKLARERDQIIAQKREALRNHPANRIYQFEFLLKSAQEATIIKEDHEFYIDSGWYCELRRVLMEIGRRFSAIGVTKNPSEIFMLTLTEVYETVTSPHTLDRSNLVKSRLWEMENFRTISPPELLGTARTDRHSQDILSRSMTKILGSTLELSKTSSTIRGTPGSPGLARGKACILRSMAEVNKVEVGDILIARFASPTLTPLFTIASAIVTDMGGALSHCAAVAREYGIPAVVGTGRAISSISEGQMIEVDGTAGIVRFV
jgi:pyruvate,water dikinase